MAHAVVVAGVEQVMPASSAAWMVAMLSAFVRGAVELGHAHAAKAKGGYLGAIGSEPARDHEVSLLEGQVLKVGRSGCQAETTDTAAQPRPGFDGENGLLAGEPTSTGCLRGPLSQVPGETAAGELWNGRRYSRHGRPLGFPRFFPNDTQSSWYFCWRA